MERYVAWQNIIRISHVDPIVRDDAAAEIAAVTADRWGTEGANITNGEGLWKGITEFSASIEIVTRECPTNEDYLILRNHITALGLTAFVTVNRVDAHELY